MASQILLNDTTVNSTSGATLVRAGETISDAETQASLAAAGGVLWPAADPVVAAAAALVIKLRTSKAGNESSSTGMMLSAALNSTFQGAQGASQSGTERTVDLATTAALPAGTFAAGTAPTPDTFTVTATGTLTVDGVVTTLGQRILVKNQATASQNGIYAVTTAGATGVQAVLTRAVDAQTSASFVPGMGVSTGAAGTTNPNCIFVLNQTGAVTLNTTSLTFSKVGSLNEFTNAQIYTVAQAVSAGSLTEVAIASMIGGGNVIAAYYLPNATSTPAGGANSQAIVLTMYNAAAVSQGTLASASIANATPATQWVRFALGALTNAAFSDGFTITAKTTLTGTATLPAGQWILVCTPN